MSQHVNILINARDNASKAFAAAGSAAGRFGSGLLSLKGLIAGAMGGFAIKASLQHALEAWGVQEQALAKLSSTLRATGGAAGFSAEQLQKYAADMQNVTTFGDEAIINGQALLATFKEIKGDVFQRATKSILDMTATMGGTDLKAASIQLGKALNDPIKGVSGLAEVGVSFTEAQRQQIKGFVALGQTAKAQGVILAELEGEFGGVAEAMAQTSTGVMEQFKNAIGDVWESIGQGLAPSLKGLVGHLQELLPYLHTAAQWVGENLTTAFGVCEWAVQNWRQVLERAVIGNQLSVLSFYEDVKHFLTEAIPTYLGWFGRNWKEVFIDALNTVGYAFENFGRNIYTIMTEVWDYVTSWGASGFEENWTDNLRGLLDGFTSVIQEEFPTVAERGLTATEQALSARLADINNRLTQSLGEALAARFQQLEGAPNLAALAKAGGLSGVSSAAATTAASKSTLAATEARFLGRSPADDAARRAADQTQRNTQAMVKLLTRQIDVAERQLRAIESQAASLTPGAAEVEL